MYETIADLPLTVESYFLEPLERNVSSNFARHTTVIRLQGLGEEGVGEDVTYDALDQIALQDAGASLRLAGDHTVASFSERLDGLGLWPTKPVREVSREYRRWAYESAALDLALRQAGQPLTQAIGRSARPVTFVVSRRLGDPPTFDQVRRWLDLYPDLKFKLDPTSEWDEALFAQLAASGSVDSVDLKGVYKGTIVDQGADPVLYRRVVEAFPRAWIEDPELTDETNEVLRGHRDRITWDAPIHSVADIESLPFPPRMLNIKPSRFGTLRSLFEAYEYCESKGIAMYGGGQFELGPGRGQIQYLASVFHPDTPNDVAPTGYNEPEPKAGLPTSPLPPLPSKSGFRWDEPVP